MPEVLKRKKAVINVRSKDNACFAWSVVAALHPAERHVERKSSYPHYSDVLNLRDISFPMTLNQVKKFEQLNNISINVYSVEKKKECTVVPLRVTDEKKEKHVNLLYLQDQEDAEVGHFVWVKNLSRLVSSQLSKKEHKKHICDRCLHYFSSNIKLQAHIVDCGEMNDCAIRLPSEDDKWLTFKNYNRKERVPFVVYADLDCTLEKMDKDSVTSRYAYQHHEVFSVGYYVRCSYDDSLSTYQSRRDKDCITWFVEQLKVLSQHVKEKLSNNVPMENLSKEQWMAYRSATHCHICQKPFALGDDKVRDHCHLTGRYRGPAHSNCNLNYKNLYCIPVVFHNLSGYDSHFIIKEIATAYEGHVELLPITKEKYISFTKHITGIAEKSVWRNRMKLRFIDSYKFLTASLDKLVSLLSKDNLKITRSIF
ncbi:PREDICTED: uncharacterized protein LOC105556224 [Vollenhovia emeryi]|uniref:uncharacterized protein LOC105556224 n=1 Tax=Vollenhovia emeryi TaxID=411798 RepID=UPI0005F51D2E|nr:PREDICTED: uncharacterized protein LOC105556224 [Vollenhovia emeryi]